MPYIAQDKRKELDEFLNNVVDQQLSVGELNYVITKLLLSFVNRNGLRYGICNSLLGVLECAKLELYRRLVGPYEDAKISENGDVYE